MKRTMFIGIAMSMGLVAGLAQASDLVVYTPSGPEITGPILELFAEQYPDISVTLITAGTGELMERLRAEKNNPAADVMFGGGIQSFDAFAEVFDSYPSVNDSAMITQDPEDKWHAFTIFAQPLLVNTDLVSADEMPSTVDELLSPVWQARGIALADPNKSGTGFTIVSGVADAKGWDWMAEFIKTVRVTPGSDQMFAAVKDGEVAVGWINEDLGAKWVAAGLPVKMIYAEDVVTVQIDAFGLVKGGPNVENGRTFVEFLGTKPVHEIARDVIIRRSARKDVEPPLSLPALGDLPLHPAVEPRDIVSARFTAILSQ